MTAWEWLREVGVDGAVDIALMSALLYAALAWLRSSRIRGLLRGAVVLGGVYLLARLFNLQLTATALESLFVLALVAAVVTYRDEIRRFIESVAALRRRGKRRPAASSIAADLARTLFDLGHERIGALVVLEGSDSIEAFCEGGTALDAEISDRILKSIFHPRSPGHDGAVSIRNGRLTRFACHLPLSSNHDVLAGRGTRHAAALGIAERTDALAVAVSEERGSVTVARDGRLAEVKDVDALTAELEAYARGATVAPADAPRRRLLTLLAAVAMSAVLWEVLVHGSRPTQRTFTVPVTPVDVAPDRVVTAIVPPEVRVTIAGASNEFYFLGAKGVRVVRSLRDVAVGTTRLPLGAEDVTVPRGLTVRSIEPAAVQVRIEGR
jgi:uncharacterized protein (TIGR00159 family)